MHTNYRILSFAIAALCATSLFVGCGKKDEKPASSIESRVDSSMTTKTETTTPDAAPAENAPAANLGEKAKAGEKIFMNASLGKIKVSCAKCHSGSSMLPGHTLAGVTKRPSTWNGMYKGADLAKNAYGATLCATLFQEKEGGLKPDEIASLNEYFAGIENAPGAMTSALTIKWAAKPTLKKEEMIDEKISKPIIKDIMKLPGDVTKGQTVFTKSCASCHDFKTAKIGPPMADAAQDMNFVVSAVRFGSDAMPFFAKDVLSDQQIADVIAYIQATMGK